jgi:hypothetical protein
MPLNSIL